MPGKHVKINAEDAADEAWLTGVFSLIPDSVYGPTKPKAVPVKQEKKKTTKASKSRTKKKNKGKKLPDMPEKMAELQERLREKIASRRADRKADDVDKIARRESRKRKRDERKEKNAVLSKRKKADLVKKSNTEKETTVADTDANDEPEKKPQADIEVSRIEGVGENNVDQPSKSKKRPRTKKMRLDDLEKQLGDAIETRNANADSEKVKEAEMEKAMLRAKGVVVKDDVSKLRKTIRKEKRKSEKSKEEWGKRVKALKEETIGKQKKREDNLKERRENKGATKGKSKLKSKSKGKDRKS